MWRNRLLALVIAMLATDHGWALSMNVQTDDNERLAYVNLWGEIVSGDDQKFRALIMPYVQAGYLLFQVNTFSGGGDVSAAVGIAEQIRILNAQTQAPVKRGTLVAARVECRFAERSAAGITQHIVTGGGLAGYSWCTCTSACFHIWASGLARLGNHVGIHRFQFDKKWFAAMPVERARAAYLEEQQRETAHLKKLNVPLSIIDQMFAVNSHSMYYLTPAELRLMQSTPYLEELTNARCGPGQGNTERQGDSYFYAYDADKSCPRSVLKEFMREGARNYLGGRH